MIFRGIWNVDLVSMITNSSDDLVRSMVSVLEFPGRSLGSKVSAIQPYMIPWMKRGAGILDLSAASEN